MKEYIELGLLVVLTLLQLGKWTQKVEDGDKESITILKRSLWAIRKDQNELKVRVDNQLVTRREFDKECDSAREYREEMERRVALCETRWERAIGAK